MKKLKFAEIKILPHHIPYLEASMGNCSANISDGLWLAAFAIYNAHNTMKLSPDQDAAYLIVFDYLKTQLQ